MKIYEIFVNLSPPCFQQTFEVVAIDGDTGINTKICYKLGFEPEKDCKFCLPCFQILKFLSYSDSELISIETLDTMGRIDVKPINRDLLKNEFFQFKVF